MSLNVSEKENQKVLSNENVETPEISLNGSDDKGKENPQKRDESNDLEQLRKLLIQPEEISEVLPTAFEQRSKKDNKLTEATLPIVEENIRQSVIRDPKVLAEALFPVIGPAIRKAISEALSSMVQNLNQTLEHSISPKSIKWRMEAYRTGKSFGEVVMLKTLRYRVEQVFLIHKETGLLLQHVAANPNDTEDADMVSAMLTAIEDFVQDSFKASEGATLNSLKIKELSVWIENSPDAVIAGVIRGNPPLTLKETFLEAIEEIQYMHEIDLDDFDGDAEVFVKSRPILEDCLRFQTSEKEESSGFFTPTNAFLGLLGLLVLVAGFFYVRDNLRWNRYLESLNAEKGIVVTETNRGWFTHSISGLRDSLAVNPHQVLEDSGYDADDVEQNWKPYQDASSEIALKRATRFLKPPDGVRLSIENQTLTAKGNIPAGWQADARKLVPLLVGVEEFRADGEDVSEIAENIETQSLAFTCNTVNLSNGQIKKLDELAENIEKLMGSGKSFILQIHGFANSIGTDEANLDISRKRAEMINNELKSRSEKIKNLQENSREFIKVVAEGERKQTDECKVTFKVDIE